MTGPAPLLVSACANCHTRFLPRAGPCPKCGARSVSPHPIAPEGAVLAAVELENPAAGWPAPHRLVLLEMAEGVRLLAVAAAPLPGLGDRVRVVRDGEIYRIAP